MELVICLFFLVIWPFQDRQQLKAALAESVEALQSLSVRLPWFGVGGCWGQLDGYRNHQQSLEDAEKKCTIVIGFHIYIYLFIFTFSFFVVAIV